MDGEDEASMPAASTLALLDAAMANKPCPHALAVSRFRLSLQPAPLLTPEQKAWLEEFRQSFRI